MTDLEYEAEVRQLSERYGVGLVSLALSEIEQYPALSYEETLKRARGLLWRDPPPLGQEDS